MAMDNPSTIFFPSCHLCEVGKAISRVKFYRQKRPVYNQNPSARLKRKSECQKLVSFGEEFCGFANIGEGPDFRYPTMFEDAVNGNLPKAGDTQKLIFDALFTSTGKYSGCLFAQASFGSTSSDRLPVLSKQMSDSAKPYLRIRKST